MLNSYVTKSNDVNQGSALEYNFSAVLKLLLFPIVHINSTELPDGTLKELLKTWKEFYHSVSRAVNLLPGVDKNFLQKEFCGKIMKNYSEGVVSVRY